VIFALLFVFVVARQTYAQQAIEKRFKGHASPWINDRSLSAVEKEEILGWIANGKVAGDLIDSPQPKTYPGGWLIGKPHAEY